LTFIFIALISKEASQQFADNGAGMGFLLVVCGILSALVGLAGYFFPAVRNAEDILPDHDQLKIVEVTA
jgi:hypothetical protein